MRYLPKSPADREAMLAEIGVANVDELFASVPEEYRLTRDLDIPRQHAESEVIEYFKARADENGSDGFASFLGAGAYRHYKPVIIDALVQRGEFLTAYTPYQPEISQGTLQAIFEFQTMICELTGMDLANASMYDGSTGAAEAVMMAVRVTGRSHAVVAKTVHPEYREVLTTYAQHQGIPTDVVGYGEDGRVDAVELAKVVTEETACVLVQSPNFFGTIEDVAALAEAAHAKGALLIVSIAEAISLGIIKPPKEADIVSLEAQSFGVALSYGGPYCGVIATREKFVRQMPGRLAGATKDKNGKPGYVLTLSTREQHIRREKATSNICTNQALVALMATIFLTIYGKQGLRDLAEQNLAKARFLESELKRAGAKILFRGAPHFHEFVVQTEVPVAELNEELMLHSIVGGLDLHKWYPELKNASLWCATETNHRADMEAAAEILKQTQTEDAMRESRRQTREMAEVY